MKGSGITHLPLVGGSRPLEIHVSKLIDVNSGCWGMRDNSI